MSINNFTLNTEAINNDLDILLSGNLISFNQSVLCYEIGTVIAFTQNVTLLNVDSTTSIKFEQSIINYDNNILIEFNQNVQSVNSFLQRTGYDVDIYINNYLIPKSELCDMINVQRSEGTASSCRFVMKTATGVQNAEQYVGQKLLINITNSTGVHRVFTGFVDNPTYDVIQQKIFFTGTDRRQTQINALNYNLIQPVGSFSIEVFGDPKDQADELEKRLLTIDSSFDFDVFGNPTITEWEPKSSADFILSGSKIYYDNPKVTYANRTKTTNTVNVTIEYKHQRLHQQLCQVVWGGYNDFLSDWFNKGQPSFPQRSAVTSAASATSWVPLSPINFVAIWPAGGYGAVQWQPNQITYTYAPQQIFQPLVYFATPTSPGTLTWPDGKEHSLAVNVLDANGNQIMTETSQTITDTSSALCRGASWAAGKKFAQNVVELYDLRFISPQGVNRYGIVDVHETVTINDPYNSSAWDGDKTVFNTNSTPPTATIATTDSTGYNIGDTSITLLAAGTGTIYVGNLFTISGDASGQFYTCYQDIDVSMGGQLAFTPGIPSPLLAQEYTINVLSGATSGTSNFFIDQKPRYSRLKLALDVVCKKAETTLKSAHRDTKINFKRSLWPEADLPNTVELTATQIAAKGKIYSITHTIDISTNEAFTDVELKLSRALEEDSQSDYIIAVPPFENISYIGVPNSLSLQTHYGIDPTLSVTPASISWTGFIGNQNTGLSLTDRTQFPESFRVNYPPLSTALTGDRTVTQNTPGINSGVTTDNAGYLQGITSINIASGGTGQLLQGDTITITGDSSDQTYIVQNDILNVSSGGVLTISPGLGANLAAIEYPILSAPPSNIFTVTIPNDPLVVDFPI